MIEIACEETVVRLDPQGGSSLTSATWRGQQILRSQTRRGDVLAAGCFPLLPFSNRIAQSRFQWDELDIALPPNHPSDPGCAVLHGFGWLRGWSVTGRNREAAQLELDHSADRHWPWSLDGRQTVVANPDGFTLSLAMTNRDKRAMPAGLGFHPYFPRNDETMYRGLHRGEWQTDASCIPTELLDAGGPRDWWDGQPVAAREVDTVYTGREGPLSIVWPDRRLGVEILPSEDLGFTTVYVPAGQDYFCVEPVSHMTDAFNREGDDTGMRVLEPGEEWEVSMQFRAFAL